MTLPENIVGGVVIMCIFSGTSLKTLSLTWVCFGWSKIGETCIHLFALTLALDEIEFFYFCCSFLERGLQKTYFCYFVRKCVVFCGFFCNKMCLHLCTCLHKCQKSLFYLWILVVEFKPLGLAGIDFLPGKPSHYPF